MIGWKLFIALMVALIFDGHATTPKIQQNIHELKDLGYTGKGVKVGVIDRFAGAESHGLQVSNFIREVAPQVELYSADMSTIQGSAWSAQQSMFGIFKALTLTAKTNIKFYALKANGVTKRQIISMMTQKDAPFCYPDLFEHVKFTKGEEVTLTLVIANISAYKFTKGGQEYYAPFASFVEGHFTGKLSGKIQSNATASYQQEFVAGIRALRHKGVKIINASLSFASGNIIEEELRNLGTEGGVFVSAAGNEPLSLGGKEVDISYLSAKSGERMTTLWHSLQWGQRLKEGDIKKACVLVGALENQQKIADYSARAGVLEKQFISAFVDKSGPIGTSFAAPQITGVLVLLQEAYPTCGPQTLSKAILKSGAPLRTDSLGTLAGRGRVDPLAAFRKAYEICGVPPQGLKGQKYLLPADFKVDAYVASNPELRAPMAQMTPAEKEAFAIHDYLKKTSKGR